jgi:hypothetical protein
MFVRLVKVVVIACTTLATPSVSGADHYFSTSINQLKFVDGKLPGPTPVGRTNIPWDHVQALVPQVRLEDRGEAYVRGFEPFWRGASAPALVETVDDAVDDAAVAPRGPQLLVHTTASQDVVGWLYWPKEDYSGYAKLKFVLPVTSAEDKQRVPFLQAKLDHYTRLFHQQATGNAWYRHQIRQTAGLLKQEGPNLRVNRRFFGNRGSDLEETYALFSGGRALSENLQLDRQLPTSKQAQETIVLESIEGITVREFDWAPAIKGLKPKRDVLATQVPDDQHVIFFPSFGALVTLADEMGKQSAPLLTLAEPSGENASVRERYERQLCLSLDAGARLLGPTMINSVALTGSDPYLRTGADVAILFEAKSTALVRKFIDTQLAARGGQYKTAKPVAGELAGVSYQGMRSPDRVICSYAATLGKTVVITNSLAQLQRLAETHQGARSSLGKLPEYTFFRARYPLSDGQETALMLISDKTIRRWCGPRWRIGSSRRTRATATMTELQASHLDALVKQQIQAGIIAVDAKLPDAGELRIAAEGVSSSIYGTLDFQTPIVELEMTHVTPEEARLYNRWRDGYQRYWSNFFDPIAVRFQVTKSKLATDVTVMPLIDRSDYREFIDISQGVEMAADFGDLHPESILHWVMAINTKSQVLLENTGMIRLFAPQIKTNPLSWIGKGISVYVDQDPLWGELLKVVEQAEGDVEAALEDFMPAQIHRLPVALHVDVKSGLKLTLFLSGVRAFIESTAPGMLLWETKEYQGQPYVKVSPSAEARRNADELEKVAVYYAASGEAFVLTLSEPLLKRSLGRRLARRGESKSEATAGEAGANAKELASWTGKNMGLQVKQQFLQLLERGLDESYRNGMQRLSWSNLPILNEWKQRYPEADPVQLHKRFWQRTLVCPGGGKYVWNDQWQTMESTVFGHPGDPKSGAGFPNQLKQIKFGNFGLTFEESGLRARLELKR